MSQFSRRTLVGMGALALPLTLAACGKPAETKGGAGEIVFAILPAEDASSMQEVWQPLIDDMQKQVGVKVTPKFVSNYNSMIEAMRFNQAQVAWLSALPATQAIDRANGQVIGRIISGDGSGGYQSLLLTKKGSGITLEKVLKCDKSLNFGLGDPNSTSGTLAPLYYLFTPKGIDPTNCFKTVRSASHQANLNAVISGQVDVATGNSEGLIFNAREAKDAGTQPLREKVDIIWQSQPIPESGIVVRKDLDPAVKEKVRSFFLTYGTAQGPEGDRQRAVLEKLTYKGFRAADDSYLDPIRAMVASNELAEAKKAGDPAATAAAQKKLDAINARLAAQPAAPPAAQ
jgi:phosphonate transport system substrate-binding protein